MKLIDIKDIRGTIEILTGLHIGAGDLEMHIGGIDNPVVKHPHTNQPYIPGSSLKGKIRSLLEWRSGAVKANPLSYKDYTGNTGAQQEEVLAILKIFGLSGGDKLDENQAKEVGPTRISFYDAQLNTDFVKRINNEHLPFTESKYENSIDRIKGTATNPRQTERVPAGALFDFRVTLRIFENDDPENLVRRLLQGLKLLELESLGGSGSRGYGKVCFKELKCQDECLTKLYEATDPFPAQAA